MLAITLIVSMSVPMASSLQRNFLFWKPSPVEASLLFGITWRRRIEEHVQPLALNSIHAFSCYLPASHTFSHKLCASYLPYHHLLSLPSSLSSETTVTSCDHQKFITSNKISFSVLQVIYTCRAGMFSLTPTPEIEFSQSFVFFLCSHASCSAKSHGDLLLNSRNGLLIPAPKRGESQSPSLSQVLSKVLKQ